MRLSSDADVYIDSIKLYVQPLRKGKCNKKLAKDFTSCYSLKTDTAVF